MYKNNNKWGVFKFTEEIFRGGDLGKRNYLRNSLKNKINKSQVKGSFNQLLEIYNHSKIQ